MISNKTSFNNNYTFMDFSQIPICAGPVWHPNEDKLYYISNMSGNFQIYYTEILKNHCLWPIRITYSEDRTTVPILSPNRNLCYMKDTNGNERWQIHLVRNLLLKESINITQKEESKHHLHLFTEEKVIFTANRDNKARFDIYEIDLNNGNYEPSQIIENSLNGMLSVSDISEDNKVLLCNETLSINEQKFHIFEYDTKTFKKIALTDRDAWNNGKFINDNQILCVTNFKRDKKALAILDIYTEELFYLEEEDNKYETDYYYHHKETGITVWSKNVAGYTKLFLGKLENNALSNVTSIPLPEKAVASGGDYRSFLKPFSLNYRGNLLAINFDSSKSSNNIYIIDLNKKFHIWKATKTDSGKISESTFVTESLNKISSFDGIKFDSYLFLPKNQDSVKKFPCIIMIHGGPEGQARPNFNPLIQFLLYNGYAVSVPNIRGSAGYGKEFNQLDNIELRMNSVKDIEALANHLKLNDKIQPSKIVVYGGSYGGFMVLSCITEYPTLFSAGIDIVGISNLVTFLENTAEWRRKLREVEYGSLEYDRDFLESISPIKKVDKIICPTLLIHGKNDERVPVNETYQIYERLKERNIPVEMQIFEDEGHGVVKAKNKVKMYKKIIEFLQTYV